MGLVLGGVGWALLQFMQFMHFSTYFAISAVLANLATGGGGGKRVCFDGICLLGYKRTYFAASNLPHGRAWPM